jgi:ABC-type proline/glycine betaine transport system substrate-binding protein
MGTKTTKKHRTRNHQVNFYTNDEEYRKLTKLVTESGLSKQTYLINATLANPKALKDIPKLLSELTELLNQFKGIGINCNQMAKIANTYNQLANENELKELANDVHETGKKILPLCQSLKLLIRELNLQQH